MKNYLKNNIGKIIDTFVAIVFTIITNQVINKSKILESITQGEITIYLFSIWVIQAVVVMFLSLGAQYIIKRFNENTLRRNIRYKRQFPFKNSSKKEKQQEIDSKIQILKSRTIITSEGLNSELYKFKNYLAILKDLILTIENIVYYKDECVVPNDKYLIHDKFSAVDINYYIGQLDVFADFADKEVKRIQQIESCEEKEQLYILDEYNEIQKGLNDIKELF